MRWRVLRCGGGVDWLQDTRTRTRTHTHTHTFALRRRAGRRPWTRLGAFTTVPLRPPLIWRLDRRSSMFPKQPTRRRRRRPGSMGLLPHRATDLVKVIEATCGRPRRGTTGADRHGKSRLTRATLMCFPITTPSTGVGACLMRPLRRSHCRRRRSQRLSCHDDTESGVVSIDFARLLLISNAARRLIRPDHTFPDRFTRFRKQARGRSNARHERAPVSASAPGMFAVGREKGGGGKIDGHTILLWQALAALTLSAPPPPMYFFPPRWRSPPNPTLPTSYRRAPRQAARCHREPLARRVSHDSRPRSPRDARATRLVS